MKILVEHEVPCEKGMEQTCLYPGDFWGNGVCATLLFCPEHAVKEQACNMTNIANVHARTPYFIWTPYKLFLYRFKWLLVVIWVSIVCSVVSRTNANISISCVDNYYISSIHFDYDTCMAGVIVMSPSISELPESDISNMWCMTDTPTGSVPIVVMVWPAGFSSVAEENV